MSFPVTNLYTPFLPGFVRIYHHWMGSRSNRLSQGRAQACPLVHTSAVYDTYYCREFRDYAMIYGQYSIIFERPTFFLKIILLYALAVKFTLVSFSFRFLKSKVCWLKVGIYVHESTFVLLSENNLPHVFNCTCIHPLTSPCIHPLTSTCIHPLTSTCIHKNMILYSLQLLE